MNTVLRPSAFSNRWRGLARAGVAALVTAVMGGSPSVAVRAEPVRVCLVGSGSGSDAALAALRAALAQSPDLRGVPGTAGALRTAAAAVFWRGPGPLGAAEIAGVQEFFQAGKGAVVLGATTEAWAAMPGFFPEILGAAPGGDFARGAPMAVITLYPHPIFSGITRFETQQPMAGFSPLPADAQMIMEGTVGEEITPLAWVRRLPGGRVCHIVPAGPELLRDPAYLALVANAVRWSAGRAIPGAAVLVQRTYLPEAHPGSFAITFPQGPGVCFDPVRGGINYMWDGDFVDLRPRWLTKQGEPARLFGEVFYREKAASPLRLGAPGRAVVFRFRGYTLKDGGPEFHYQVDGRDVFETLSAIPNGSGLRRHFRVGAGAGPLWLNLEPQPGAEVVLGGLERDGDGACYASPAAGAFTIEIRRRSEGVAP